MSNTINDSFPGIENQGIDFDQEVYDEAFRIDEIRSIVLSVLTEGPKVGDCKTVLDSNEFKIVYLGHTHRVTRKVAYKFRICFHNESHEILLSRTLFKAMMLLVENYPQLSQLENSVAKQLREVLPCSLVNIPRRGYVISTNPEAAKNKFKNAPRNPIRPVTEERIISSLDLGIVKLYKIDSNKYYILEGGGKNFVGLTDTEYESLEKFNDGEQIFNQHYINIFKKIGLQLERVNGNIVLKK